MRKNAGSIMVALLLLVVPALANAWTLTVKVAGGTATDNVKVVYGATTKILKGGTSYLYPTGSATITFEGAAPATSTLDGAANAGPITLSSGSHIVAATYAASVSSTGFSITQADGGVIYAKNMNGTWTTTGISGVPAGTVRPVTIAADGNHKIVSYSLDGGAAITTGVTGAAGQVLPLSATAAGQTITATFAVAGKVTANLYAPTNGVATKPITVSATASTNDTGLQYAFAVTGPATFSQAASASQNFSFTPAVAGTYTVTVNVTSANGGSTSASANVNVAEYVANANTGCVSCHSTSSPAVISAYTAGSHGHTGVTCQSCHNGTATHGEASPVIQLNTPAVPVVANAKGFVTAAVCANCHKTSHDEWKESLHTLKAKKGPALLNGSTENISPWAIQNWSTMETYQILGRKANIASKNYIEMYVSVDKKQPADVAVVIGQDRKQRYAVYYDGSAQQAKVVYSNNGGITYKKKMVDHDSDPLTPTVWEEVAMPAQPDRAGYMFLWLEVKLTGATPAMNSNNYEEWRSWQERCIACHTTGFDRETYNTQMANYKTAFAAAGNQPPTGIDMRELFITEWEVSCENCHGPGKDHALTGDKTKIVSPAQLDKADATQNQTRRMVCESCHTRTNNNLQTDIPTANRTANDRRGFVLGDAVNGVYGKWMDYTSPAWGSGNRQVSIDGKGRRDHQMTMDIQLSKYIKETVQGGFSYHGNQNCFDCHKSHDVGITKDGVNQFKENMLANKYGHDNMVSLTTDDGVRSTLRLKDTREALCAPCHVLPAPAGVLPQGVTAPQYASVTDLVKVMNAADPTYGYTFSATAAVLNTSLYATDPTAATNLLSLVASNWATEGGRGGRNQHLFNKDLTAATTNKAMGLKPEEYTWQVTTVGSTNAADYTAIWPWAAAATGKTKVYGPLPTGPTSKAPTTTRPWTP